MADLQSIIKIIFSGEDQLSGTVRNASSQISGLGDIAETVASPFASLANAILLVDAALVGVATVIGVQAVQASSKFGTSLSDLNRFLSESEGSADDNRVAFQNLSLEYGTNINDVVASTADWKAANFDLATSLELTQTALDYSIAGQISAGEATDLLKRIIAGMAVEQDKAAASSIRFGDVINAIADSSSVNFKELAIAVAGVAPSIELTGGTFEQITSILAVMTDVTQSGSESQSAFNVIMGQVQKPTKDAAEALEKFGIKVGENGITQTQFYDTLAKLATKWPELTKAEQAAAAQTIVSSENVVEFTAIMNGWGKSVEYNTVAVEKATGSMASEVARSLDTAEKAFEKFGNSLDLLFISLGDQIQPGVVGVTNSLKDLIVELGYLAEGADSPLDPLFDAFGDLSQEIARVIDAITENLDDALATVDFSGLLNAFSGLFGELDNLFTAFFGDLDITTVEGLSAALQKIVDVGQYLVTTTQGIIAAFNPFAEAAGRAVDEFTKLDSASQLDFGKFIGSAKLLVDAGVGLGSVLIAIGQSSLDMGDAFRVGFGTAQVAANALQLTFDAVALKYYEIKKASLESKIADEDTPWGNQDKVIEYKKQLDEVNIKINAVTENLDKNASEFDEGYNKVTGVASEKTVALRKNLQDSADSLNKLKDSIPQGALSEFASDVQETTNNIADSASTINGINFDLEAPDSGEWDAFGNSLSGAADKTTLLGDAADSAGFGTDKFTRSAIEVSKGLKEWTFGAAEAAGAVKRVESSTNDLFPKIVSLRDANGIVIDSWTEMSQNADAVAFSMKGVQQSTDGISVSYSQVGAGTVKLSEATDSLNGSVSFVETAFSKAKKAIDDNAKSTEELTKKSESFKLKMEEIASNERIKTIEAVISLNVSQLETDMERVKAAFASIDNTVSSTGDLLGGLFGNLADSDFHARSLIENQIALENKRREEALELQKKLTKAEIERIEAQRDALNRGVSMIEIDGKGLQPHLEAFMFEILKEIRVKLTGTYSDFLLALAAPA